MKIRKKSKLENSFSEKVKKDREVLFYFSAINKLQIRMWYLILVDSREASILRNALKEPNVNIQSFGEILHCGVGKRPSNNKLIYFKEKYGLELKF